MAWLQTLFAQQTCPLCDSAIHANVADQNTVCPEKATANPNLYSNTNHLPVCTSCFNALPWCNELGPTLNERSTFYYEEPIRQYVLAGKGGKQLDKLQQLGQLIAIHFSNTVEQLPQAILPVPLHTSRLRQRGFNQSIELIRPFAQQFNIPILTTHISRNRATSEQKGLTASHREANMHRAFSIQKPLNFQHVAIFDDIITTGATCSVLRGLLVEQGIRQIDIWCCATTKQ